MARIAGVLYITANGQQLAVGGKWEIGESTVKREAKTGLNGKTHYVETPQPRYFDGELQTTADTDPVALEQMTDVTVTGEFANGRVVTLVHAFTEGDFKSDMAGGTMPIKFIEQA